MRLLLQIDEGLARLEQILIVAIVSGMVVLAFLQVVLRNLWEVGLLWLDILLRHLVLWLGILGASLATRMKRHIRIDVLARHLPSARQRLVERGVLFLAAAVSTLLGLGAVDLVRQEQATGSIAFGPVPTWVLQLVLPVGFMIFAFRFVLQALSEPEASADLERRGETRWAG